MSRKDELRALAERVIRLDGPCRETDALIWRATVPDARHWPDSAAMAFTASLDAAMRLRLPGYRMNFHTGCGPEEVATAMSPQGEWKGQGIAKTLPCAITAAWLLACAAQVQS